jgi:hypothetical protein
MHRHRQADNEQTYIDAIKSVLKVTRVKKSDVTVTPVVDLDKDESVDSETSGLEDKPEDRQSKQITELSTTNSQNIYSSNPLEIESMLKSAADEDFEHVESEASVALAEEQIYETINEFNTYIDEASNQVYSTPTNRSLTSPANFM